MSREPLFLASGSDVLHCLPRSGFTVTDVNIVINVHCVDAITEGGRHLPVAQEALPMQAGRFIHD